MNTLTKIKRSDKIRIDWLFVKEERKMEYKDVHLTDLRRYAKKLGVRAPTHYNKDKLIEMIIEIEKGEVEPYFTNKGRPSKAEKKVNELQIEADVVIYVIKKAKEFLTELEGELEEIRKKEQAK